MLSFCEATLPYTYSSVVAENILGDGASLFATVDRLPPKLTGLPGASSPLGLISPCIAIQTAALKGISGPPATEDPDHLRFGEHSSRSLRNFLNKKLVLDSVRKTGIRPENRPGVAHSRSFGLPLPAILKIVRLLEGTTLDVLFHQSNSQEDSLLRRLQVHLSGHEPLSCSA